MTTIKEIRKSVTEKTLTTSIKLHAKLSVPSISLKKEAITDLTDIYEVCSIYVKLIDKLLLKKTTAKDSTEILRSISNDLYVHLPYHFKSLKKPLQNLIEKEDMSGPSVKK